MSFWNTAIGVMIGFTIGGAIGALVGGVIGAKLGKKKGNFSFSSNQKNQVAFFAALFACLAKLAKADGRVSKEEIQGLNLILIKGSSQYRFLIVQKMILTLMKTMLTSFRTF